jgi:hypothetical protein
MAACLIIALRYLFGIRRQISHAVSATPIGPGERVVRRRISGTAGIVAALPPSGLASFVT